MGEKSPGQGPWAYINNFFRKRLREMVFHLNPCRRRAAGQLTGGCPSARDCLADGSAWQVAPSVPEMPPSAFGRSGAICSSLGLRCSNSGISSRLLSRIYGVFIGTFLQAACAVIFCLLLSPTCFGRSSLSRFHLFELYGSLRRHSSLFARFNKRNSIWFALNSRAIFLYNET